MSKQAEQLVELATLLAKAVLYLVTPEDSSEGASTNIPFGFNNPQIEDNGEDEYDTDE